MNWFLLFGWWREAQPIKKNQWMEPWLFLSKRINQAKKIQANWRKWNWIELMSWLDWFIAGGYEPEAPLRSEIAFINFQLIPPTPFAFSCSWLRSKEDKPLPASIVLLFFLINKSMVSWGWLNDCELGVKPITKHAAIQKWNFWWRGQLNSIHSTHQLTKRKK